MFGFGDIEFKRYEINSWKFVPTEDITAYELSLCPKSFMTMYAKDVEAYQRYVGDVYNNMPDRCKRFYVPIKQVLVDYNEWQWK